MNNTVPHTALCLALVAAASLLTVACDSSDPERGHATLPDAPPAASAPGSDAGTPVAQGPAPTPAADAGAAPDAAPAIASFDWLVGTFTFDEYDGSHPLRTNVLTLGKDGKGSLDVQPPAYTNPTPDMLQHTDFAWTTDGKTITAGATVYPIGAVDLNCRIVVLGENEWRHTLGGAPCPTAPLPLTALEQSRVGTWRYKEADAPAFTGQVVELEMDADRFYRITLQPTVYKPAVADSQTQVFYSYFSIDPTGIVHGLSPRGQDTNGIFTVSDVPEGLTACTREANPTCFTLVKQ